MDNEHCFDYYAKLAQAKGEADHRDGYTVQVHGPGAMDTKVKVRSRDSFMKMARKQDGRHPLLRESDRRPNSDQRLDPRPSFKNLPQPCWFAMEVSFTLQTSWYSKDDRPFDVLDNPVRREKIFGAPFISASSWKGMLRWACLMEAGLLEHLETSARKDWQDPAWITHLFGNRRAADNDFQSGVLVCYPTWFDRVDFEIINPHDRAKRAGTNVITYEVIPQGSKGTLSLLYAPSPGREFSEFESLVDGLVGAIRKLFTTYGISAKRTAGWGVAAIEKWKGYGGGDSYENKKTNDFKDELKRRLRQGGRG